MATKRPKWTRTRAADVLADQQKSGMCIAQFAQARGLNPKRLYRWRRRLNAAEVSPASRPTSPAQTSLVPVEVIPARAAPTAEATTQPAHLTLRTATGHAIDIPAGFDGDTLLRILDVLTEAPRC